MLFNINKQKSLALLQITIAVFILVAPSLLGILSVDAAVFITLTILGIVLGLRVKSNEKVYISINNIIYLIPAVYGIVSSIWINNRQGQLVYIFALVCISVFSSMASEYFAENSPESLRRRIMYMLGISGVICAISNIIYWVFFIVPVAGNNPFSLGFSSNNLLGIFMALCIIMSLCLLKGNSRMRRALILFSAFVMAFVFIMTKSVIAWAFVILFSLGLLLRKVVKSDENFVVISLGCVLLFILIIAFYLKYTPSGGAFSGVFSYAFANIFGRGGGFWEEGELFLGGKYSKEIGVGLLAYAFGASGILGILGCIFIASRNIILFTRLKSAESLLAIFISVSLMLLPFGGNITAILFWVGINAYNEQMAGRYFKVMIKKNNMDKTICIITSFLVLTSILSILSFAKMNAACLYRNKDYKASYEVYKLVATVNRLDSESCRMAVSSMRKANLLPEMYDEAIKIIDKAIKRDADSVANLIEKALVYEHCGEYELSAQQYREAIHKAIIKDDYCLALSKVLYKIVEMEPKGSSETKRAYEEIVSIAQTTDNLDLRKEINDIADKALGYTKGELTNGNEILN